ncbi:serine hydrolase domain-containing protein [Umezawaea endophytica]|uniref:Beta-lactamase family protein n=1 Tax=Umezawaea endophytica TaxID=1654476 RepID=A0A9X3AI34_9PSEU|nr:serine hydrolase domain-containing protein [Umezawaea endophytica]MCS7482537.1 beta-lactamase family protein [Umezawaea endophytica]
MTIGTQISDAAPHPPSNTPRATAQRDADALLKFGAPGVLVGLDREDGDVKVRSGVGNRATKTPVPWEAKFRIGSFTKTFVAATLLQLVGEGRLSLDDTVDRWLPGLVAGNGNDGTKITVRQLLQHTSGLPDYTHFIPWLGDKTKFLEERNTSLTPREAMDLAMKSAPLFQPGTSWSYSNTNYLLAGMIIGKVSGNDWRDEVTARIIKPLKLVNTSIPGTKTTLPTPHAIGYQRFPGEGATPEDPKFGDEIDATAMNPSWANAAGEMISTVDDTNRFLRALMGGRILKRAQLAQMLTAVDTNDLFRKILPGVRYGLGIMYVPNSCGGLWTHGGDIHGFKTRNGVTPDGSRSVVVSINTDSTKPDPGIKLPTTDFGFDLINHALCGPDTGSIR